MDSRNENIKENHEHNDGCFVSHDKHDKCCSENCAQENNSSEHGHECGCGHEHSNHFDKELIIKIVASVILAAGGFIAKSFDIGVLSIILFIAGYLVIGSSVLLNSLKSIGKKNFFDENTLMSIATVGAIIIGEYPEAIGVMLFYQVGELIQGYSVKKSKSSISALMDIRPDYANLKKGSEISVVSPSQISVGELIIIKAGEKIPLDGVVEHGSSLVDTSSLTGESVRRTVNEGDNVLGGCLNGDGLLTVRVTSTFENSTVAKILDLIENADSKKSVSEKFITRFARIYTPIVVLAAAVIAVVPSLITGDWFHWVYTALLFLVISCPCALVLSVPLTFFCGIGACSKKGVLVKGSSFLEAGASLKAVAFDKTGTVTEGSFEITRIIPSGVEERTLLEYAAAAEFYSNHPIAQVIKKSAEISGDDLSESSETAGMGVSIVYKGKKILAGNSKLMDKNNIKFSPVSASGSLIYVSADDVYAGCIVISDTIKKGAAESVDKLKKCGIERIAMLTGDAPSAAEAVAGELGISEYYSSLLPQQKVEIMQEIIEKSNGKAAFVGDGINDAPVLKLSPLGISVGALGSDAAVEASDVVLMNDNIGSIADFVKLSAKTLKTVKVNVGFVFLVKIVVMVLGIMGYCPMWAAIFADVGVCLLAVLNAVMSFKKI